ncbi:formate dehydrogenase accessory sulfurtransferase FdhD [Flavobacteriaceae bacterium F08102]|nr:formate dehydrogenase accessory sulfurtransferase FdhD [Flavobacteriaceae bacterium F08102]
MESLAYEAIKTSALAPQKVSDNLVVEAGLQININGEPYTVVMRTPGNDYALIRGLLYAEDIYKGKDALTMKVTEEPHGAAVADVKIPPEQLGKGYLNKRSLLSVSSCGICGKQTLDSLELNGHPLQRKNTFSISKLKSLYQQLKTGQSLFLQTGGSHATAAFDITGKLLSLQEDIGRHNTLDKVVGDLLNQRKLKEAACILVSGRVSYEIVSKAFIAKIPIIMAVSACSSLAVDFAKEFGICLIGFSRNDKATIYANPAYINYEV